ncbi:hypothetical protein LTR91_004292 [Friedmanniomyces endolithicus]|uniref:cytidine deaminase n=1 Tax=Friedmanniomyces endolithicus TaxID=329885 RepID=A0AAN6KVL5_9PEZI|nr:hypothetical protein LTR94_005509 [Friedmanniomyces endolithicus]KAK0799244.1 hypothetical protein LTR59_006184 [Friedmanniomyces endolithicus]KAK0814651.1 hypothetical protein LTR75_004163 [Friedmanniomyces endolithicus]KAK0847773.1 hypothetical protein LTR03_006131 [Friedmanniomyces endolithicus]KAK0881417.1 hypothetical protein LTR87_004755 [Friedmanniomyces endolithicus]
MADQSLYTKLTTTAEDFVLALSPKEPGSNQSDDERFLSHIAPNYTHSWGHKFFVGTSPGVQGSVDGPEFLSRMNRLAGKMQTWYIEITETCVDVEKKSAALKADFHMTIAGHEPVLNEIVWWLKMDGSGEKVVDSCEYIDPVASSHMIEQMKGGNQQETTPVHGLSATDVQKLSETCPYSHFRVGCSILLANGTIVQGANVENAAYPVTTCAERVAMATAVVQGAKKGHIRAVAVATDISPPASPCGMCRQFLREFCELDMPIFMFDKDGKSTVMTLEELLPMSFGPESLLSTEDVQHGLHQ